MHIFLYQAARHAKPTGYYNNRRRYSQTTIRCDFDLELLKKGIKGRYQILGHGTHPFQQAMKQVGLEEEFYGHVIAIEDSRNAVWFKLNYDNIGKHQTKYIGGWRDLDADHIVPQIHQYQLLDQIQKQLYNQMSAVKSQMHYVNGFASRGPFHPVVDQAVATGREYHKDLTKASVDLEVERDRTMTKITDIQDQVRKYLDEHKG